MPGASVDDHRAWIERMRSMTGATVAVGVGIFVVRLAATVLSVTFATRGAMATNRPVIEVLHFVGAKNGYIASNFLRHFLFSGIAGRCDWRRRGNLAFALASVISSWFSGTAGGDQTAALFGSFSIGFWGYAAVLVQVILIAAVTALTSRRTVNRTLETID